MVEVRFFHNVSVLYFGPMDAESTFEKMLPSNVVLGVDESSKGWFSIVGVRWFERAPRIPCIRIIARSGCV